MELDEWLDKLNPYETYREGQKEAIKECITHIDNGAKVIVIDAPTGSGKSCIVEVLAKHYALTEYWNSYICTPTNNLQEQYMDQLKYTAPIFDLTVAEMKGKSKYDCNTFKKDKVKYGSTKQIKCHLKRDELKHKCPYYDNELNHNCLFNIFDDKEYKYPITCDNAPCSYMFKTKEEQDTFYNCTQHCKGTCNYSLAKKELNKSDMGIVNYNLLLSDIYLPVNAQSYPKRNLLFLDEAHNLYAKYQDYISIKYSIAQINDILSVDVIVKNNKMNKSNPTIKQINYDFLELHPDYDFRKDRDNTLLFVIDLLSLLKKETDATLNLRLTSKSKKKIIKFQQKIDNTLEQLLKDSDNYHLFVNKFDIELTPITLKKVSSKLHLKGDVIIMLSGSLTNLQKRMKLFGFNDYAVIHIKETRNLKQNNPVIYSPVGSMSRNKKQFTLPKLCAEIENILNNNPNTKGIIHTTNYPDAQYILENVNSSRLITYSKNDNKSKKEAIHEFRNSSNKVLIGFSVKEGVDFPNEDCRFQIITKIPFPQSDYSLETFITYLSHSDEIRYNMLVGDDFIQMCGRGCRSNSDYCINYVLDSAFEDWINRVNKSYKCDAKLILGQEFYNSIRWD